MTLGVIEASAEIQYSWLTALEVAERNEAKNNRQISFKTPSAYANFGTAYADNSLFLSLSLLPATRLCACPG